MALHPIYTIKTISSEAKPEVWTSLQQAAAQVKDGYVVATLHQGIYTGMITNGNVNWLPKQSSIEKEVIVFDEKYLVEIRLFNETKELYYWKDGVDIKGRLRNDGSGDAKEYVDTEMLLRGVVANRLFELLPTKYDEELFVETRNYIEVNEIGQVGYADCRFLNFKVN